MVKVSHDHSSRAMSRSIAPSSHFSTTAKRAQADYHAFLKNQLVLLKELDPNNDNDFAIGIQILLRTRGKSQKEIARMIAITPPALHRWRQAIKLPRMNYRKMYFDKVVAAMETIVNDVAHTPQL